MRLFSKKLKQVFISLSILSLILSGVWPGIGAGEVDAESKEGQFKTSAHYSRVVKSSASNVRFAAQDVQSMALTITLKGDAKVRVISGERYVDEGASAIDGDGNDISDRITSNANEVDSLIPGVYTITYRILDDQGNDEVMPVERIVTVAPPAVTARGGIDTITITEAMALAVIKLYDPSLSDQVPLKTGQADENGRYQFRSFLYPGTYMVTQTVNGVESDRAQAKVLSPGEVDPDPGPPPVDPGPPPVDDRPKAREDTYITFKNTILKGTLTGFDPKGGALTFVITEYGQKGIGKITNPSTGDFVYVPYPDETGTDFFTFKVNNGRQDSGEAKITIEIQNTGGCPDTKIIYVKQGGAGTGCSWDDALSNLQDAIDKSEPGDQIWIAKGTYTPTGNQIGADPRTVHFKLKNGVAIYGGFAGNEDPERFDLAQRDFTVNETILSGKIGPGDDDRDHVYHVFYHDGGLDQTAVLDGVTITGGWASSSDPLFRYGGGMLNVFSSPTLMNVTISGNTSSIGGGIANMSDSSPTLTNVTISGNTAGYGGGIANVSSSSPTFTNVTITGNTAEGGGGGIANLSGSSPTLTNVTISGNMADSDGGGIANLNSSPTLTNVTISGNTAEGDGGGIANLSGSSPTLTNVTISGNTAEDEGAGIANLNGSNTTILNSIVWGNGISDGQENNMYNSNSAPIIDFSLIGPPELIAPNGIDPDSVTVEALFIAPKLFDEAPTTEGDYRLNQGSPAINAGNNGLVPDGIETDLDGNPRRVGERVDLGAYEYQGEEAPVPKTIEVSGAGTIAIPGSSEPPKTETYNALVLDENDDAMPEEKVEWSVTATEGVSIDRKTGVLTVTEQAPTGSITVTATLVGNPAIFGEMNVTLQAGSVEPPDTEAPQWQDGDELTVSEITQTSVKLSWPSATDNVGVMGYRVYVDGDEYTTVSAGKLETTVLDLEADKEYAFEVTAYDEAGNESAPLTKTAKTLPESPEPDTEAPQWPKDSELTVSDITQTSVKLSWPSAVDNVSVMGYRISVDGDEYTTVSAGKLEATVLDLEADKEYAFEVTAYDEAGNESAPLTRTAKTLLEPSEPDTEAPQWPKDGELTVSDITQTSVKLSWPSATDNVRVMGYRVYVDGDEYTTVSAGKLEMTVLGLEADKEYAFEVTAYDEAGNESAPLTRTAKTLPEPSKPDTEAPQWRDGDELIVSDITQTSVKLSWPSATDNVGVKGYRVYVDNWIPHTVSASVYEYTVTSLHPGTTYTFSVKAFDEAGNESAPLNKQATTTRSTGGGGGSGGGRGERSLSNNANLADLQVWAEGKQLNLSPSFASGTTEYTARTEAEQVELVVKEADSAAKVILHDKVMTFRIKVDLKEDDNKFEITVQAENGTKKKYTLTIYRDVPKPTEPVIEFTDIAGHWAESYSKRATANGVVSGYPDGTFKPNNPVTRAEFTVMLAGTLKLEGDGSVLTFTDHDQIGAWAKQAVARAVQAGIVDGYSDGSFRPNTHITRAEMATMIARVLKLELNANATTGFADDEAIPQWAKGAVEAIRKLGIADGRGGNLFAANETATRAEATVMLLRLLEVSQ
ncbi:fibronectin type III domain-containing protein [Paenibacillus sp. J2TS4]|uniref:fibronectin type III domain-containing protein n=1 Tax=Paenibacillus sp. J2TS4 TaxID=2807194 RepID=UPI001B044A3D|nr:S-layer homology domain-containing protein [Paenibacillus sp. J2TS4]GIP30804.1 hypothetical protein J2TS4_00140 [Paenibacillus sp. J2TS4]